MPRERANERACDLAIRKTLAYRAVFKYPLSYYQLCSFLISKKTFKTDFYDRELLKLVKRGTIGFKYGRYFDKRIKPSSWDQRLKQSKKMIKEFSNVTKILSAIPWIKLVCVTGSVAAYNADRASDIDMFIVTSANRLWLTRGFVAVILKILGVYANSGIPQQDAGKICPNLLIDETQMSWPEKARSLFTAHEIVLMQPIVNRNNTYLKFLKANEWVRSHFANFCTDAAGVSMKNKPGSKLVDALERLAMKMQLRFMGTKKTSEITENHIIHFKKNDNSNWILENYNRLMTTITS